jgi:hypothetical protein
MQTIDFNYESKYIKYKKKYLDLKKLVIAKNYDKSDISINTNLINHDISKNKLYANNNIIFGGGKYIGEVPNEIQPIIKIKNNLLKLSGELKSHYETFWNNIYYNDAYIYHKISIDYYKNVENDKFHFFFSAYINKKLYTGSCQYIDNNKREDFINSKQIKKIDMDDLCILSTSVINNLDIVFNNSPKLKNNVVCFRSERRNLDDQILKLKPGEYYFNNGYMSTTIDPYLYFWRYPLDKEKIYIQYTIFLPSETSCYYMNIPFGIIKDKDLKLSYGFQEYEILIPRNCIFRVLDISKQTNIIFIKMYMVAQTVIYEHIKPIEQNVQPSILTKNQYKNMDKEKFIVFKNYKPDFGIYDNIKIDIYNLIYKKLWKIKINFELYNFHLLLNIQNKYLNEWIISNSKTKPIYDSKKYPGIKNKDEFEKIYNNFIESQKYYEQINNFYINIEINYMNNNELYNKFINIKTNTTYKFENPIIIYKKLPSDMIIGNNFICDLEDKIYKENKNYPISILIHVFQKVNYLPQSADMNFCWDLKKIKIISFQKIYLYDEFYFIMAIGK